MGSSKDNFWVWGRAGGQEGVALFFAQQHPLCPPSIFIRRKDFWGCSTAPEALSPTAFLVLSLLFLRFPTCVCVEQVAVSWVKVLCFTAHKAAGAGAWHVFPPVERCPPSIPCPSPPGMLYAAAWLLNPFQHVACVAAGLPCR